MSRTRMEELRVGGLGLAARFCLSMSLALAVVMAVTGFFLFRTTHSMVEVSVEETMRGAAQILNERNVEWKQIGNQAAQLGDLKRFEVEIVGGKHDGEVGHLYQLDGGATSVLVPARQTDVKKGLLGLFLAVTVTVVLVGAGVALLVGTRVARPLDAMVDHVRQISHGNFDHRSHVQGGGEVALLARSIDRMAGSLTEAQDAELELSVREREREVAQEVREALLPGEPPKVPGYQVQDLHIDCPEPGGDFHDFVQVGNKLVLLVCDVSGAGVPGALVGATARAYLRHELERGGDLVATLSKVNRDLARDVRRGMYVTTLCVVLDPDQHTAEVACAGHKIPLVRYGAADKKLFTIQPEGIALGFDKGSVFDSRITLQTIPVEPGDRLVLTNTGTVKVLNPDGEELGEKAFYRAVLKSAQHPPKKILAHLHATFDAFADGEPFPADISLVALARDA